MKASKTIGLIGGILVFVGGFFKVSHYPGASIMLIIGQLLLTIFLITWVMNATKNATSAKEKNALIFLGVVLLFALVGSIFKIQHYPGAFIMLMAHFALTIILIPVYLIYVNSEQDKNKGYMRLAFLVAYMAITGLFLAVGGVSKVVLNGYVTLDRSILAMTENTSKHNAVMYATASADSAKTIDKIKKVKDLSDGLSQYISQLKVTLLNAVNEDSTGKANDADALMHLGPKDNFDVPNHILINDVAAEDGSKGKANELKNKITDYKKQLEDLFDDKAKAEVESSIGLKTDEVKNLDEDRMVSWEKGTFYNMPAISDLVVLDQLQYETRNAEGVALSHLIWSK